MKVALYIVFIASVISSEYFAQDETIYLSPGVSFSWDLNGNFIFSPKLSVGYYKENNFYNVTIGRASNGDNTIYPYYYAEIQFGVLSKPMEFRKLQLFTGGGIGINFHQKEEGNNISFRATIFSGYGAFIKATLITREKINADFGIETVLPIPLNFKIGSPGG